MPIPVTCEHCGESSWLPDEQGGKTGECPKCGQSVDVPVFTRPRDKVSITPVVMIFVVVMGVLFCCVLPGMWLLDWLSRFF